jgi:hypothetical protein
VMHQLNDDKDTLFNGAEQVKIPPIGDEDL